MAVFNKPINIDEIITVTDKGVDVADYNSINDCICNLYRKIYGTDIDLSNVSADGQWAAHISLILNNMAQTIQWGINSLNPQNATGSMLDIIASLTNIVRKKASNSYANVFIKNISGQAQTAITKVTLIDKNSIPWVWEASEEESAFDLGIDEAISKTFVCSESGAYSAKGTGINYNVDTSWELEDNGDIYQALEQGIFQTYQPDDAIVGSDEESDTSLRTRMAMSSSNQSVSIISALKSALLSVSGIKDVYIYDNKSSSVTETMDDGTKVSPHNVYVCIRYEQDPDGNGYTVVTDDKIGSILYNKMTPGIMYQAMNNSATGGIQGSYQIDRYNNVSYTVYWKKCTPRTFSAPNDVELVFNTNPDTFAFRTDVNTNYNQALPAESATEKVMAKALCYVINNAIMGEPLTANSMGNLMQQQDPKKLGLSTYLFNGGTIFGAGSCNMDETYFNVKETDVLFEYNQQLTTCIVTVGLTS